MRGRLLGVARFLVPYALVLALGAATAIVVDATLGDASVTLASPRALWVLSACILLFWVSFHLHVRRSGTFTFSRVIELARTRRGWASWLSPAPRALRIVAIGLCGFALARPQTVSRQEVQVEGIDLMIVLDLSRSMQERDMLRNRLDAAQRTIRNFLKGRKSDKIGLVVFAKQAMLQCPLTLDYAALDAIVADLRIGDVDPMGTAIGDGLGLAVASLRRSDARSKVAVLLTDGDSNVVNEMSPDDAISAAREHGVRVFTVLMGRDGGGSRLDPLGRQRYATNPDLLRRVAAETDGRAFHAGDALALERGFEEVRAVLEKSKRTEVRKVPTELYGRYVTPAAAFLLLEILLSLTRFRRFP